MLLARTSCRNLAAPTGRVEVVAPVARLQAAAVAALAAVLAVPAAAAQVAEVPTSAGRAWTHMDVLSNDVCTHISGTFHDMHFYQWCFS